MSRSPSYSRSPSPKAQAHTTIDRQKTTPFLLHLSYRLSSFHHLTSFPVPTPSDPHPPLPTHLQIYTWSSCTLRELAHLLVSALPSIVPEPAIGTRLGFRLVYPDTYIGKGRGEREGRLEEGRGRYTMREMGSVVISAPSQDHTNGDGNGERDWVLAGDDSGKTLADSRFVIGDYIDCAIFPPLSDGSTMPRNRMGGSGYGQSGRARGGGTGLGRGAVIPAGEWRRGERLPEGSTGYRGRGGLYGARRAPY